MPRASTAKQDRRKVLAVCLNATNDVNGNPRRVYCIIDPRTGNTIDAIDEGYGGFDAVTSGGRGYVGESGFYYPNAIRGPIFQTTPAEYRDRLRRYVRGKES